MGDMRTFAAQTEATTTVRCQKNSGWTNNQIDLHQFLQVAPKADARRCNSCSSSVSSLDARLYLPEGHYETDRRLSDFDNLIPALVGTIPNKRQLSSPFHGMAAHCNGSL